MPEAWANDPARLQAVGLDTDTPLATKPALARRMLERVLAAGPPVAWVTGDTVYGRSRALRSWLEGRGLHHVLAVPRNEELWAGSDLWRVDEVQAVHAHREWPRISAGAGSKRGRGYDWQCWVLAEPEEDAWDHYLLFRLSLADPDDWQGYVAFAPQNCDLETLVAVAGSRWPIEHAFEAAKQETGLDDYEVRSAHGWDRQVTLVLLTVVRAADLARPDPKKRVRDRRAWRPSSSRAAWSDLASPPPVAGPGLPRPSSVPQTASSTTVVLVVQRNFILSEQVRAVPPAGSGMGAAGGRVARPTEARPKAWA